MLMHFIRGSSCSLYPDRQLCRTVTDGRHPGLRFAGGLEAFDVFDERTEQRFGFEQRERAAHAGVDAVTPAEVAAQIAAQVEPVRVRPLARIAVRRGEHEAAALAFRNHVAVEFD